MKQIVKKKISLLPVVIIQNQKATTTSLEVARIFEKKHQHVLRDIGKLDLSESFSLSNFGQRDYVDERGKVQPMYEITRDGFVFLAMGYTGTKASQFKESYISEFNRRESEILRLQSIIANNRTDPKWLETRAEGKEVRLSFTDTINRYKDYAKDQGSTHFGMLFMSLSKMINSSLFDVSVKCKNLREMLDVPQLKHVATAEFLTEIAIEAGMEAGLHYKKEINPMCKAKVESFATLLCFHSIQPSTIIF
jgi:Rha family phage regulatory protein